jgi:hypothetical protein
MDTRPDDLNDFERRLAALAPAGAGLDADAMLFAAGRASAQAGLRLLALRVLTAFLALLAVGLGAWGFNERVERMTLAEQLEQAMRQPAAIPPAESLPRLAPETASADQPGADSVLASHQTLENGLDGLPVMTFDPSPPGSVPAQVPILRARSTESWPGL